jgi:hypothetical protein
VRLIVWLFSALLLGTLGCGGSTEPAGEVVLTMQNISGVYLVSTFTTEENGVVTNQVSLGGNIQLVLYGDGTTDGALFIPAGTVSDADLQASLLGTWQLNGNVVTLNLNSDVFLEDMDLVFEQTHLTGETTRLGVIYRVVLAW